MRMFLKFLSALMILALAACKAPSASSSAVVPYDIAKLDGTTWQYWSTDPAPTCLVFIFKKHPDFTKNRPVYFVGFGNSNTPEDTTLKAQQSLNAQNIVTTYDGPGELSFATGETLPIGEVRRTFHPITETTAESIPKLPHGNNGWTFLMELQ